MEKQKWYKNWKVITAIVVTIIVLLSVTLGLVLGLSKNSENGSSNEALPEGYEITPLEEYEDVIIKKHFQFNIPPTRKEITQSLGDYTIKYDISAEIGLDYAWGTHGLLTSEAQSFQDIVITLENFKLNVVGYQTDGEYLLTETNITTDFIYMEYYDEYMSWDGGSGDVWKKYIVSTNSETTGYFKYWNDLSSFNPETDFTMESTTKYERRISSQIYEPRAQGLGTPSEVYYWSEATYLNAIINKNFIYSDEFVDNQLNSFNYEGSYTTMYLQDDEYGDSTEYGSYQHLYDLLTGQPYGIIAPEYAPQYMWTTKYSRLQNENFEFPTMEWLEANEFNLY